MRSALPFGVAFASTLTLAAALSYWSDPAARWARREALAPQGPIPAGMVWLSPKARFDNMQVRLDEIGWSPKPYLAVFGSSRIFAVSNSMLSSGRQVLNLGVGHASLAQHIMLWEALRREGKVPSAVLVDIDPWTFDARETRAAFASFPRHGRFSRGRAARAVIERIPAHSFSEILAQSDFIQPWILAAYETRDMLQWSSVFFAARQVYFSTRRSPDPVLVPETEIPTGRSAFRSDGSVIVPPPQKPYSAERAAEEFNKWEPAAIPWRMDSDAVAIFGAWLDAMLSEGCQVHLLIPPYQPDLYKLYERQHPEIPAEVARIAAGLAATRPAVVLCSAPDPAQSGCSAKDFADGLHAKAQCLSRIVTKCLESHPKPLRLKLTASLAKGPKS